jgi:2-dehydropantoate 2-reductase
MRVLVVGAGATGGCFGARLAAAGRDVTFLVRPARAARLRADGLVLRSPRGDLRLRPQLITSVVGTYDVVLLAVKAYGLARAVADLAPSVGAGTAILPVLNGMRHLDVLAERFGAGRVLGGVCQVTTTLTGDGEIHQLNDRQELVYGAAFAPAPPRLADVHSGLSGAGITTRLSADIRQEMWDKWVYVASVGAVTCLMRGVIGEVVAAPGGARFAEQVVVETAAVAAACGHPVAGTVVDHTMATVTKPGSDGASSLYRDLLAGAQVESEHIIGDLVALAGRHGVDVPLLRLAHTHLFVHQRRVEVVDAVSTSR